MNFNNLFLNTFYNLTHGDHKRNIQFETWHHGLQKILIFFKKNS